MTHSDSLRLLEFALMILMELMYIAEGPRDDSRKLKSRQPLHNEK